MVAMGTEGTVAKRRSCLSLQLATDRPVFSSLLTHTKQDATGGYGRCPVGQLPLRDCSPLSKASRPITEIPASPSSKRKSVRSFCCLKSKVSTGVTVNSSKLDFQPVGHFVGHFSKITHGVKKKGFRKLTGNPWYYLVGAAGFELATPCTPCKCATRLRYAPTSRPL